MAEMQKNTEGAKRVLIGKTSFLSRQIRSGINAAKQKKVTFMAWLIERRWFQRAARRLDK